MIERERERDLRDTEIEEWGWGTLSLWPGYEKTVQPTDFLGSNGLSGLCVLVTQLCHSLRPHGL